MLEKVAERGKEPEPVETHYDLMYRLRQEWLRQRREGAVVIRDRDRSWEQTRQGLLKYLCYPNFWNELSVPYGHMVRHKIKRHSGKHVHQGGLALFVLEGKGYTVVDGVRYDWERDDLILLPVKPDGCEHQHFNADPSGQPAEWLSFIFIPFLEALGAPLEQRKYRRTGRGQSRRLHPRGLKG